MHLKTKYELAKFAKLQRKSRKCLTIECRIPEFGSGSFPPMVFLVFWGFNSKTVHYGFQKRCKGVHCVDLGESFPTHIFLQNLASIKPRTSPVKFASFSADSEGSRGGVSQPPTSYSPKSCVSWCGCTECLQFVIVCWLFLLEHERSSELWTAHATRPSVVKKRTNVKEIHRK